MLGSDWPGGLKLKNLKQRILFRGRLCRKLLQISIFFFFSALGVAQTHTNQSKRCVFVLFSAIVGSCCLDTWPQVLCLAFTPLGVVRNKNVSHTHAHNLSGRPKVLDTDLRVCLCGLYFY